MLRLLTRHATSSQPRLIDAIENLLSDETDASGADLRVAPHDVVYAIVRFAGSYGRLTSPRSARV
jgi:Tetracyclin repressor-like, C-terminal domain